MKALSTEIRNGQIDQVRQRLAAKPELVHAIAKSPPKKDDGQSPLQVALKTGNSDIAQLLLDRGADVNFMDKSEINEWNCPVVQDAVKAAVMRSRWLRDDSSGRASGEAWVLVHSLEESDKAFAVLERMVSEGADVHAVDSYGGTALLGAVMDARQILPSYHHQDPEWVDPKPLNAELIADLNRIFNLLYSRGANLTGVTLRDSTWPITRMYAAEPVARFFDPARVAEAESPAKKRWRMPFSQ